MRLGAPQPARNRRRATLVPPSASPTVLRRQAPIYRQGKTPVDDGTGTLKAADFEPATTEVTARQLAEVRGRFGEQGLARSIRGLALTRGNRFATEATRRAGMEVATAKDPSSVEASTVQAARGGASGKALPALERAPLERLAGHSLAGIRIYDNPASHRAARALNARAFTLGSSIYFDQNEYRPHSSSGRHLLAHEVAHTVQQGELGPQSGRLPIAEPDSSVERQADHFADASVGASPGAVALSSARPGPARIMRVIRFRREKDAITTRQTRVVPHAADFDVAAKKGTDEHFEWHSDLTILGSPGDPFSDFELSAQQVVRDWKLNVFYGHGDKQTVRRDRATLPARDEAFGAGGPDWYHNTFVVGRGSFGSSGVTRTGSLHDSPTVEGIPFDNPAPKAGPTTGGRFEFVASFVAHMTSRNAAVSGVAGFTPLAHLPWRLGMAGVFDSSLPSADRFRRVEGGKPTRGRVADGTHGTFPPMHGGTSALATLTTTTT